MIAYGFSRRRRKRALGGVLRANSQWAEHEPELDLALHTGLRRTDMYVRLMWENVDLASRTAEILRSKNGDPVRVPLNADAFRAVMTFRKRGDGTGRVVRNKAGETLHINAHWFVPALKVAGITNFHWHDLRHTFATRLHDKGTGLGTIADLLGHRQLVMTRRYAHTSVETLHKEVPKIEKPYATPTATEEAKPFVFVN